MRDRWSTTRKFECGVHSFIDNGFFEQVRLSIVGYLRVIPPSSHSGTSDGDRRQLSPPVFIAQPSQVRAVKGDRVTLDCAANGHPRPQISWLKDGASIDMR